MVTAAAMAARSGIEILRTWHATQLEGFADILADGFLNFLHLLLGIEESARDRIIHELFTLPFEFRNLFVGKFEPLLLFMTEVFPPLAQQLILQLDFVVRHKTIDLLSNRPKLRLLGNGLAKLNGFLNDDALFGSGLHILFNSIFAKPVA